MGENAAWWADLEDRVGQALSTDPGKLFQIISKHPWPSLVTGKEGDENRDTEEGDETSRASAEDTAGVE